MIKKMIAEEELQMEGRKENERGSITLLGSNKTKYSSDYDPTVLETFPNKHPENDYFVKFNCPEFTCSLYFIYT